MKPDLEAVEGSAAVKVSGGYEDEVQVFVDQQKLAQLGLSIDVVTRRIRAENVNLSGGRLEQGMQRFLVRTLNEFGTIQQMADAIIATRNGQPVYLRDVATVSHGYKEREAITRVDGKEAIELAVYKEGDANTVQLASGIRARVEEIGKSLPEGTVIKPVYDQSHFIDAAISEVKSAALIGGLLAILVLYAFLRDARATLDHRHRDSRLGARHFRDDVCLRPDAQHHVAWAASRSRSACWWTTRSSCSRASCASRNTAWIAGKLRVAERPRWRWPSRRRP